MPTDVPESSEVVKSADGGEAGPLDDGDGVEQVAFLLTANSGKRLVV